MLFPKNMRILTTPDGQFSYVLVRSGRRRTIGISINEFCQVSVAAPLSTREDVIQGFLTRKAGWILKTLGDLERQGKSFRSRQYDTGEEFLFLGKFHRLEILEKDALKAAVFFDGIRWKAEVPAKVPLDLRRRLVKERLVAWYQDQAKELFAGRVFQYGRLMGLGPQKITVRTQKRLWGSCGPKHQSINLNWLLIMAPLDVIDYVVVHELAHLSVADHSHRFWKKVADVLADYKIRKKWLKDNRLAMILP
jgi:predicted metal-dependent hydrolase